MSRELSTRVFNKIYDGIYSRRYTPDELDRTLTLYPTFLDRFRDEDYLHHTLLFFPDFPSSYYEIFLKHNTDINVVEAPDPQTQRTYGNTALHLAIANEAFPTALHLAKLGERYGYNVNTKDALGKTPLRMAAIFGYRELVIEFIRQGADVNLADNNGITPLMAAHARGDHFIIGLLEKAGADKTATDNWGYTAESYASNPDIAAELLSSVALHPKRKELAHYPTRSQLRRNESSLLSHCLHNQEAITAPHPTLSEEDLLKAINEGTISEEELDFQLSAHPTVVHMKDATTMPFMALHNSRYASIFLGHGADVNMTAEFNGNQIPLLTYAILTQQLDFACQLIIHDADLNKADSKGFTPLMAAHMIGDRHLVNYLELWGSNSSISDHRHLTAQDYSAGNTEITRSLLMSYSIDPSRHFSDPSSIATRPKDTLLAHCLKGQTTIRQKDGREPTGFHKVLSCFTPFRSQSHAMGI